MFLFHSAASPILEYVYEGDGGLGDAEVVLVLVRLALDAVYARAFLVPQVGVADAYGRLDVPVGRQNPVVAVGQAAPGQVAVVALGVEAAVELGGVGVQPYEVSFELLAQPVACLGLGQPEAHLLIVFECPGIVGRREVEGPAVVQRQLHAQVGRRAQPVKRVGLEGHVLRRCL